jgi:hypothetical protein
MEVVGAADLLEGLRDREGQGKRVHVRSSRVTYVVWAMVCRSAEDQTGLQYVSHNRRLALFEG